MPNDDLVDNLDRARTWLDESARVLRRREPNRAIEEAETRLNCARSDVQAASDLVR